MINNLVEFHNQLFFWLYSLSQGADEFSIWLYVIAERIDMYVIAIGIIFILIHHHKRRSNSPELLSRAALKEGLFIVFAILVSWLISYLLKITFAVPRPFLQFSDLIPLFPYGGYDSFPSGHATLFAAMATAIYRTHKKVGLVFIAIAFLIGITRVIAGVHFPIDVLFGWLLGAGVVIIVSKLIKIRRKKARL